MKAINLNQFLLTAAVTLAGTSLAHAGAGVVGGESDNTNIEVGSSVINAGPHQANLPGVGVDSNSYTKAMKIDFSGLKSSLGVDQNGVTSLVSPIAEPDHTGLGVFHFAEVGDSGVWYGEWSKTSDVADGSHAVFYVGEDGDTSVPSSGVAYYSVQGMSDYSNNGILDDQGLGGNFQADFGNKELTGTLENGAGYAVDIGVATIHTNGTFSGASTANAYVGVSNVAADGDVAGRFFNSQSELAGFVTFGENSQYDTAFGGSKD